MQPFAIATIEEVITEESSRSGDVASSDMSPDTPCGVREALADLLDGCWDHVDWRDSEVIAYPADWHQNYRTGDYEATTLVVRASDPRNLERLARLYDARKGSR